MACSIVEERDINDKYSCGICHNVLFNACRPMTCQHIFCKDCLYNWYTQKQTCPMCIRPFKFESVIMERKLQNDIARLMAYCERCEELVKLSDLQSHRNRCAANKASSSIRSNYSIQTAPGERSILNSSQQSRDWTTTTGFLTKPQAKKADYNNNSKSFQTGYSYLAPGVAKPTGSPAASNNKRNPPLPNRYTFKCPYCTQQNFTMDDLREHCNQYHKDGDKNMVCPICKAMPWGDPEYKSIDFITHLNWRHKFEYDQYVDYNLDDEEAITVALRNSLIVR